MDASIRNETLDSTGQTSGKVSDIPARKDFYFRPDPWVNSLVEEVEGLLEKLIQSDNPMMEAIGRHMLFGRAKRLRPTFVLLSQHLYTDKILEPAIECASAAELIHCATLFHDDVIDNASTRKGRKSANALWGDKSAVIMGDHFFVLAYKLLTKQRDFRLIEMYVAMCEALANGVMQELNNARNVELTEQMYFEIIRNKTAVFFRTASAVGGYLGGATEPDEKLLAEFGFNFGLAFQISDDLLDLFSDPEATGKPRGSDIRSGVYTVPLIYALREDKSFASRYRTLLESDIISDEDILEISDQIRRNGAMEYTLGLVEQYGCKAFAILDQLPEGRANDTLRCLLEKITSRDY